MHLEAGGQVADSPPIRVVDLRQIFQRRLDLAAAGTISPPPDLVAATRCLVDSLDSLPDDALVNLEMELNRATYRLQSTAEIVGQLPVRSDLNAIRGWFAALGYGLSFKRQFPMWWAGLTRLGSDAVFAPKYGGGSTQLEAAVSARERYRHEQTPPGI